VKYADGQEVKVGDIVKLWSGCTGLVVANIDSDSYTENYPKTEWGYLKHGILVDTDTAGVIHYPEADEELQLITRA
jgi:hypothetical protein